MWHMPVISSLGRWRQKGQELKATLNYVTSLKPAWAGYNEKKKL